MGQGQGLYVEIDVDAYLGRRLRRRRRSLGLSQQALAQAIGARFQQIHKYETGENRISAARLWALANALGVSPDYFFEGLREAAGRVPAPTD